MTLLIDMDKPDRCVECKLQRYEYFKGKLDIRWCAADEKERTIPGYGIPDWCPIIGEVTDTDIILLAAERMGIDGEMLISLMKEASNGTD
ncbi:MAG: hypothetical protein FWD45_00175 [Coriobacteriia bacterium]|nr:hypothetical protein [Coriobacteriia bacterium]